MSKVIIACPTIRLELTKAIAQTGVNYPVLWTEPGLHDHPDQLHQKLQETIDRISNVEYILLGFGYCGNALLGLHASRARLVIPRVDDCVTLLLGSSQKRAAVCQGAGAYFLTRGWIETDNSIVREYRYSLRRYGRERTEQIMKIMLGQYRRLVFIDTGAYSLQDACLHPAHEIARLVGMEEQTVQGSLRFLKDLLKGPWDERFLVLKPGEEVTREDFQLDEEPFFNQPLFASTRGWDK